MKPYTIIALILLIFVGIGSANAIGPVTLYGGVGYSKLSGPDIYKDVYENGFHLSAGVGFNMAPALQIVPKVEYHSFAPDILGTIVKMKISMFGADARLSIGPPGVSIKPVLLAGIGLASTEKSINIPELGPVYSQMDTDFYYNLGAGIDLNRLTFQIRYVSVSSEGETLTFIPFTVGLKF